MFKNYSITLLTIAFLAFCSIPETSAQTITASFQNKPLSEVLQTLSNDYGVKIAYDSQLASRITVSGNFINTPAFNAIEQLLKGTPLEAVLINNVIVIRPINIEKPSGVEIQQVSIVKEYKVLGLIRDADSNEPLPYASIVIAGTTQGTASNIDGFFSLTLIKADSILLKISYLGYGTLEFSLHPPSIGKLITLGLRRQENLISDAVIVKRQPDIVTTSSIPGLLRWNSNRNTDIPSLNGLDIAAPLQLLPGIDGTTENLSGLLIRKSTSDKNLFIFDGFTVYHIDHFFGAFTSFNCKSVKDIRVFKGGFDARWGGRASSVVELTGKTGNSNSIEVDAGFDLLSFDAMVEGPIGNNVTFLFAARRSFTDFFRSGVYYKLLESARSDIFLASKNYPAFFQTNIDEPRFVYSDINSKITFKPSEKDNLSLTLFVGNDAMDLETETSNQTIEEQSNWGNGGVGFRWSRQWSESLYHNFTVGLSQYHLDYFHIDSTLRQRNNTSIIDTIKRNVSTENRLNDINISWNNTLKLNTLSEVEFGIQVSAASIKLDEIVKHLVNYIPIIDTSRIRDNKMISSTIWGQYGYSNGKIKSLKMGLRASHYTNTSKIYWEPRFQLSYEIGKSSFAKFSAGRYYQFINQINTYSANNFRRAWILSDDDRFPVVSSNHIIGGFLFRISKGYNLDFELYHKKTEGITVMQTVLRRTGNGNRVQEEQVYLQVENRTKGLDILFHKEFPSAQIWLAYTLSQSVNQSEKINKGNPYPAYDDQKHEIKLAGTAKWRGWGIALATIYGSGKPWDEPTFTSNLQLSADYEKNSHRLPPYLRVDAGINYTRKYAKHELKAGINIFNILNRCNQMGTYYSLSDTPLITYLQTGTPLIYNNLMGMGVAQSVYFNVKF
jgi:hypothetical protein